MGIYRVLDEHVVSESEYRLRATEFNAAPESDRPATIEFSGGKALSVGDTAAGAPVAFTPIGRGLPLTVMLRDVYTGRFPKKGLLGGGSKDIAVVSGVKNYDVFSASARALNFIAQGKQSHSRVGMPSAFAEGTALISYSPAVLTDSQIVTVEFAVDNFPGELFDKVSSAFTNLSGLPILLPAAGYLMGAAGVVKLAGGLGEALFDGRPAFSVTRSIDFDVPGIPVAEAEFRIITEDDFDASAFKYDPQRGLIDAAGRVYDGDAPYVVISIDGKPRQGLEKFKPTVASASVLQRFFQMKDGAQATIDTIMTGVELVSDLKYRDKALELKAQIDGAAAGTDTGALKADLEAVLKNISSDVIRPK
ncbi:MAG TPA: hypothetical protein VFH89_02310 [Sphingomicrobium sp.]|nr:hypothetical protein [Sphingomicrobium sp.]